MTPKKIDPIKIQCVAIFSSKEYSRFWDPNPSYPGVCSAEDVCIRPSGSASVFSRFSFMYLGLELFLIWGRLIIFEESPYLEQVVSYNYSIMSHNNLLDVFLLL